MELWDVYDIARNKKKKTMLRGREFAEGDYHMVIHICIFNSDGKMLIQQRQSFKEGYPNLWDITVGGSAICGESSQTAAERELFEELGIRENLQGIRPKLTINFDRGFDDVYLLERDISLDSLVLQYAEVQNAKWASKEEILKMIENGTFIPYYPSLITLFFDTRNQYGCHQK